LVGSHFISHFPLIQVDVVKHPFQVHDAAGAGRPKLAAIIKQLEAELLARMGKRNKRP